MELKCSWLGLFGLAATFSLTACGGSDSTGAKTPEDTSDKGTYATFDDLPGCGKKLADEIYTVKEDGASYICNADEKDWIEVVASAKKLPTCNAKKEGLIYYVDADEEYVVCNESGEWGSLDATADTGETKEASSSSKKDEEIVDGSSSSVKGETVTESSSSVAGENNGNGSEVVETQSSSSVATGSDESEVIQKYVVRYDTIAGTVVKTDTLKLHQTVVVMDTTYVTVTVTKTDEKTGKAVVEQQLMPSVSAQKFTGEPDCANAMFCGKQGDERVETGLATNDYYGWWYAYTDSGENGDSEIKWPHGLDANDYFVPPSVLATAGIKGKVNFGSAYEHPYVGVGFNLVDDKGTGGNISGWDGMCVIYYALNPMYLEIQPQDDKNVTGYNNPKAILPASVDGANMIADIDWGYFVQEDGWGKEVSTSTVLKKARAIAFKLTGEPGSSNTFIIYAVGKKGTCSTKTVVEPPVVKAVDVLGGMGDFIGGTGKVQGELSTGSALIAYSYAWAVDEFDEVWDSAGTVKIITNKTKNKVLEFYPFAHATCDESWHLQLKKNITLEKGYSYQILLNGYDYGTHLEVPVGLQDADDYTMITDKPNSWNTEDGTWESTPYKHCSADQTARLYVNGCIEPDAGFAIESIKVMKTPASCN